MPLEYINARPSPTPTTAIIADATDKLPLLSLTIPPRIGTTVPAIDPKKLNQCFVCITETDSGGA